jgi:hypothetical protein
MLATAVQGALPSHSFLEKNRNKSFFTQNLMSTTSCRAIEQAAKPFFSIATA